MAPAIFTLGYQQRGIDEYVRLLSDHGIGLLVDVRETAWSHKPGFSKSALSSRLAMAKIEYVHARFAGNPKRLRQLAANHAAVLSGYEVYLRSSAAAVVVAELDAILRPALSQGRRVCVLCYERHPEDCHRSILLREWMGSTGAAVEIHHLAPSGAPRLLEI